MAHSIPFGETDKDLHSSGKLSPWVLRVTATSHMLTYAISRERLLGLVNGNPKVRQAMFEYMRQRYADEGERMGFSLVGGS